MGGGGGKGETTIVDALTVALTTENDGKNLGMEKTKSSKH